PLTLTLFPYTTLFRSSRSPPHLELGAWDFFGAWSLVLGAFPLRSLSPLLRCGERETPGWVRSEGGSLPLLARSAKKRSGLQLKRSEEHTSELQSRFDL